ncbi:DUF3889 domain-containing protein [Metabacillus sp. RGM 3146]|uniref:DUF3889 domain-containing protein n=1 Tax=Metabacillus sp. RGM 3146 TaxID=3401092 RepID=UPI003B9C4122
MLIKWIIAFSLLLPFPFIAGTHVSAAAAAPSADWKATAIKEAKKRYPAAVVMFTQNYWTSLKKDPATRQFRITMTDGSRQFAVFVTIRYHKETNKVVSMQVLEER